MDDRNTEPIVGIDLGTTNSLCAVLHDGKPTLIPNAVGNVITPSVVGMLEDRSVVVGQAAAELRVTQPDRTISCFKRWMGTNRKVELAGQHFDSNELSGFILRSLREDAEKFLDREVRDAVISVPAYFNDNQRKATQLAGQIAGLNVRRIINEPTAAALTYGFQDRDAEKNMIVIDLGGGTFDVTVMEACEGALEIVSTAGETMLGGEDFTSRIVAAVLRSINLQLETAELKQPFFVSRLRQECETAKRSLNDTQAATIRIPEPDGRFSDSAQTYELTRETAREMFDPLIKRLARPIGRAVRDARLSTEEIDEVILVGGATRSMAVRAFVSEMFQTEPHANIDPDQVVALGACVQAALITDDEAVEDMVMTDVCPFTLGIEISREFGRQRMDGYYLPIIHRNTTIPVSKEELVYTVEPNQYEVDVKVYQGESRKTQDNLLLGNLTVKGIPPGPSGQGVYIRFTYDLNGVLEVEAVLVETGEKFTTVLAHHAQNLSDKEIEAAVKRMNEVKFYPRDDMENRRLLLFAERIVGEISPHQRESLDQAIDAFERAMAVGDRDLFEHARTGLLVMLSSLGFELESPGHESD